MQCKYSETTSFTTFQSPKPSMIHFNPRRRNGRQPAGDTRFAMMSPLLANEKTKTYLVGGAGGADLVQLLGVEGKTEGGLDARAESLGVA